MSRRKIGKIKKKIIPLLIIVLFILLIWGVSTSPLFNFKKLNLEGSKEIDAQEIEKVIKQTNIFFVSEKEIKNRLSAAFPKIAEAKIEKNILQRTIKITVTERERVGITCKAERMGGAGEELIKNCFYFDKSGTIFENAPQTSGSLMLFVKDFSPTELVLGNEILKSSVIASMSEIKNGLSLPNNGISFFEINILPPKEIKAVTSRGWYIFFDLTGDIIKQIAILKAALKEKISNVDNLEYIDLRIENRIYYK